ncbi:hypothetical protein CYY_006302 [Polysphondylium violaceum]|uniref:Transmembrane protein n=1 Tax=Polysphondylium violaceum TaxID=133409 RepID=A0A8J4PSE1_9MYCE|nr:hypothetical protein CYY_006302 [Polysphondylium violaceum]
MSDYSDNNNNHINYNNIDNHHHHHHHINNESVVGSSVMSITSIVDSPSPKRVSFSNTPSYISDDGDDDDDDDNDSFVDLNNNNNNNNKQNNNHQKNNKYHKIDSDSDQDDSSSEDEDNNIYQIVVNNKDTSIKNNSDDESKPSTTTTTTTTTVYQLKNPQKSESQKFWRFIGLILQLLGVLAITFTIFLGLFLDGVVDWSYWILFIPVYLMLALGFLATGSRLLSKLVSWVIRIIWRIWLIGFSFFVVFLILYLEYSYLSIHALLLPLLITFAVTLLTGIGSILFGACCNQKKPKRKRKYVLSGLPLLFLGLALTPSGIMIGLRIMNILSIRYSICFIPLFVGDCLFSCFSFLLLIFSFGGRENATFTIPQLFSILVILLCDITFKILIALKLDSNYDIKYFQIFIPILVGELFLLFCGFNVLRKPLKTQYLDDFDENSNNNNTSNSINSESSPLLKSGSSTPTPTPTNSVV